MSRSRINVGDIIDEIASIKREMNDEKRVKLSAVIKLK